MNNQSESEQPDVRETTRRTELPPARGIWRFSLLLLTMAVVSLNIPFITRHFMVSHDSKQVLGIFDYVYSNWLYSGELPQWMAYGLHGLDARAFQIAFLSAPSYLTIFAGKLFQVHDSLALFSIALCLEQLCFLLGMYLLSRWLFRERLTVFCVCLAAAGSIAGPTQLFFNLRIFCLLPLAFYLILRLRHEDAGWCGWLAGIVCLLGPLGSTYSYVLWAFLLTVFSLTVFWRRFGALKSMFRFRLSNIIPAVCFLVLLIFFGGSLWHALDNHVFGSRGRDGTGNVTLFTFLTYGGGAFLNQ